MADRERLHPARGLKASGRRLWKSTVDVFVLEEHEWAFCVRRAVRPMRSRGCRPR
jgi:hypothetical protein